MGAIEFNEVLAAEVGLEEAILVHPFQFWITDSIYSKRDFHDGRTWAFTAYSELAQMFYFWPESQIRRILDRLVKKGILLKGNYSKNPFDRKMPCYAFVDEAKFLPHYTK